MRVYLYRIIILISLFSCQQSSKEVKIVNDVKSKNWEHQLDKILSNYGHRNWIVVADMAYPQQSKEGITTIYTGEGQTEIIKKVFDKINSAPHVKANLYLDKELDFVDERYAKGIEKYRNELKLIIGKEAQKIMHEDLIAKLDNASKMFNVLILKTDMVLPYTSLFFELECGYWSSEAEDDMRERMKKSKK